MELRQLFDGESYTYTYLLIDGKEAVLIDPVLDQLERDMHLLQDLGIQLKYVLDTHVHADHVSALGALREKTGCLTGLSHRSGADCADLKLKEGDSIKLGNNGIGVLETPGHTNGCLTYHVNDGIFTGDALLVRGCGRTDFQQGDPGLLYDSVVGKLFRLPDGTKVYPAHDYKGFTSTTIGEEKRLNPRLTKSREEFIKLMKDLKLDNPKKIQMAVPLNLKCGKA